MNKYLYEIISSAGNLSLEDILLRIGLSAVLGIFVFLSYRLSHTGTIYSAKFNITLLSLTVLTATVMTVIGNNVALSLGMVGALSIIRFRTSIKDSRDTIYIFWTIIIGICCGVGDFAVASVGSAIVFFVLLIFGRIRNENRLLLIIRGDRAKESEIRRALFEYFPKPPVLKAENTTFDSVELLYEVNLKMLEKAQERERTSAIAGKRTSRTLAEIIYAIGGIDYVNTVEQNDAIY